MTVVPLFGLLLVACALAGCGDDVTCPTGMAGSPCRYTNGAGDPPTRLPPLDVNGADALDTDASVDITNDGSDSGETGPDGDASESSDADREARAHDPAPPMGRALNGTPDVTTRVARATLRATQHIQHSTARAAGAV